MTTTYFLNILAQNLFKSGNATTSLPSNYYIGLSKTTPKMDGTGVTEPATNTGYSRVLLSNFTSPTDGVVKNTSDIVFNECISSWGTITHFVIFGDKTSKDGLLMYGELRATTIDSGDVVRIKPEALRLSVSNPV